MDVSYLVQVYLQVCDGLQRSHLRLSATCTDGHSDALPPAATRFTDGLVMATHYEAKASDGTAYRSLVLALRSSFGSLLDCDLTVPPRSDLSVRHICYQYKTAQDCGDISLGLSDCGCSPGDTLAHADKEKGWAVINEWLALEWQLGKGA